jgi:hypothetical protein
MTIRLIAVATTPVRWAKPDAERNVGDKRIARQSALAIFAPAIVFPAVRDDRSIIAHIPGCQPSGGTGDDS